jgi:SAM-dependent methyltransferase
VRARRSRRITEDIRALNALCPYFTMFPLEFPMSILKNARHGLVLDPFCGRGTTNLAARVRGLPTVGIDSSPVAVAATAAKLSRGAMRIENIGGLARNLIAEQRDPVIPQGEFWDLAYHPDVLRQICSIREGLQRSHLSDAARALRGLMLGALHGPKHKSGSSSYFSNQAPRTYGPKPNYAVKFWKERGLRPPVVDVVKTIEARAKRAFGESLKPVRSRVWLGDSRSISWSDVLRDIGPVQHVVTSPPYYGLRTYRPDQWLREWFLGGSDEVCYTAESQVGHRSPEAFAADLAAVWTRLAEHVAANARMVIRFGAINDRPVDPASIIRTSIMPTPWRIVHMRKAGLASSGRRQAISFRGMIPPAVEELDVYCRLAA